MVEAQHHTKIISFFLAVLLFGVYLIYQPGLTGPFLLDDFDNLGALEGGVHDWPSFLHYMSIGNAGPLDRPISKISFLINDNAWPSSPNSFKWTNLFLHILIGVVLFALFRAVASRLFSVHKANWLALFTAAIWLLHPIQVSTVLYPVQRMTQLSTLFMVIGIAVHCWVRLSYSGSEISRCVVLSANLGLTTILAMFSKENGALLPVFIAVVEITVLAKYQVGGLTLWWRRLAVWIPALVVIAYILYIPRWSGGYRYRDFTLEQRLLTESVIFWDYLKAIFSSQVYQLGLFHDDYNVYKSLWNPIVLASIFGHLVLLVLAVLVRKRLVLLSFGILWFYAGHLIESTTVPLELYFEHRNYLSLAGISFAFMGLLLSVFQSQSEEFERFYLILAPLLIAIVGAITFGLSNEWGDENKLYAIWAAEHPDSPRAQRTYAQQLANIGLPEAALDHLDSIYQDFPDDLSIPVMSASVSCAYNLPQRYEFDDLLPATHKWTDGLRPASAHLLTLITLNSCIEYAASVAKVLEQVDEFGNARPGGIASLLVIAGQFYMASGDGDAALRLFKRVDGMRPNVDSATRIAGLFLGAGRYEEARKALEIAIERDAATGISESKMREYERIFSRIDQEIEKNTP